MARLIYSAITSLDGYIEDAQGRFDWAAPDRELMAAVNELERPIGTYLYGRRMYETMLYWETHGDEADHEPEDQEFTRIWRAAEKVVYSTTLDAPTTAKTRIEHDFDPGVIRQTKEAATADISIGGAEIAGHAFAAGLVDEFHLFLHPVLVGGGKRALPDGVRVRLVLVNERRFGGVVHLHYRVDSRPRAGR
jgi:dihydrofolate reductase